MTDEKINADADVAARYFRALVVRGLERAEAVALTSSYMSTRSIVEGHQTTAMLNSAHPRPAS